MCWLDLLNSSDTSEEKADFSNLVKKKFWLVQRKTKLHNEKLKEYTQFQRILKTKILRGGCEHKLTIDD